MGCAIRSVLGISTQRGHCSELCVNGVISTDPFIISSASNDYFCEVGHNLKLNFDDNIDFERCLPVRNFECFNDLEPATLPEIKDILFKFDDLSSGYEENF